jgi:hypothetical protein
MLFEYLKKTFSNLFKQQQTQPAQLTQEEDETIRADAEKWREFNESTRKDARKVLENFEKQKLIKPVYPDRQLPNPVFNDAIHTEIWKLI